MINNICMRIVCSIIDGNRDYDKYTLIVAKSVAKQCYQRILPSVSSNQCARKETRTEHTLCIVYYSNWDGP